MVALHEDTASSNIECDICDIGDPPVNRCTTCSHFLCEFCSQAHRRGRSTHSHSLISLEEAKKMGSVAVTKPLFCREHEGEVIKIFCETCKEAICRDCTIVKHRDHEYAFVKDAFTKSKESLMEILSEAKTNASVLKEAVGNVLEMEKNVNSNAKMTVQEVINYFNELSVCLDARRDELIGKVEELKNAKLKSLEIQREELETALGSVQSSVEFTERAFENGSKVEILNMLKQMASQLQGLNSAKRQLKPCVGDGFNFESNNHLKHDIIKCGAVTVVFKRYTYPIERPEVVVKRPGETNQYPSTTYSRQSVHVNFKDDNQLKHDIVNYGAVTDVSNKYKYPIEGPEGDIERPSETNQYPSTTYSRRAVQRKRH